ncbi:DegV family EDD domain-containing protein [Modestobacter sp. I12A-02628]|uniref:DegV family protein n=1 Tax=Goekera deserti TaxID=2497753 RepID=A0A7K3WBJ2_9ACTN|nr:DegV family protein [Goekera deserti]MPQ97461.1 DegV family EDD domain-containing protein [Goekera deserti]NDI47938.1 DegV family EDD domain-containing protein [Goekera deserti]NEL53686.1 DegV family protein [Goekera deserti]
MRVAVVTDSTAYLPPELVERHGIEVVPLYVVLAGRSGTEGRDVSPADVAQSLAVRGQQVSTSRPTPGDFVTAYRRRLAAGADAIVSVHLSGELSGTWDAARLAAAQVGEHVVTVVDSRSAGMGGGFAVLAAARAAAAGADAAGVAAAARETAAGTRTFFVVDTLEHLRRGGRIGSAAAVLGTALAVKPVLHVEDGRIVVLEKVRTSSRALARLVQRAVEVAGDSSAVAVHHLAAPERAERLAEQLRERLPHLTELHVSELGAAIGAHVGPGAVGIVVDAPRRPGPPDGAGDTHPGPAGSGAERPAAPSDD